MNITPDVIDRIAKCGKQRFDSAHAARETAARIHKRGRPGQPRKGSRPVAYHCDICGFWHWGNAWGKK